MVREYLVIRLGVPSPYVDELLWRSVREWWHFYFVLTGDIPPENRPSGPILGQYEVSENDSGVEEEHFEVEISLGGQDQYSCWRLIRPWKWLAIDSSVNRLLEDCRRHIDNRDIGYQAVVEAPWTQQQWQSFCQMWLFGPPAPAQSTLHQRAAEGDGATCN